MSERDLTLRAAEKLLRVGKLDAALAKYHDVLAAHPDDHATAVVVAGLLYRAGRTDAAMAQFTAAADALAAEGETERAADVYKRIISARPDDEHALEQAARLAQEQENPTEARDYLLALADARTAHGNTPGALDALATAARIDPSPALLEQLFTAYVDGGQYDRAREYAVTATQRRRLARAFEDAGQVDAAITLLTELLAQDPSDVASVAQIARIFVQQGNATAAVEYLTDDMAGEDPEARLAIAEILCRGGKYDAGLELLERTVADHPDSIEPAGALAGAIAARAPEHGELAIRLVADSLCAQSRWSDAATALERFIAEKPDCIEAIVQLVEVAVDGHLAETAERAQARLANAYLANGSTAEAMAILEDLASRHPEQPMYATQLRQALVMAGETNPDTALQQRLTAAALTSRGKVAHSSNAAADHASTVVPFRAVV